MNSEACFICDYLPGLKNGAFSMVNIIVELEDGLNDWTKIYLVKCNHVNCRIQTDLKLIGCFQGFL